MVNYNLYANNSGHYQRLLKLKSDVSVILIGVATVPESAWKIITACNISKKL
jgi:hypothetical protein